MRTTGLSGHHLECGLQVFSRPPSRLHRLLVCCPATPRAGRSTPSSSWRSSATTSAPLSCSGCSSRTLSSVSDRRRHRHAPRARDPEDAPFHPGEVWNYDLCVELLATRGSSTRVRRERGDALPRLAGTGDLLQGRRARHPRAARRDAEKLGTRFHLRQFHEAVLSAGSVGLTIFATPRAKPWCRAASTCQGHFPLPRPVPLSARAGSRKIDPQRACRAGRPSFPRDVVPVP